MLNGLPENEREKLKAILSSSAALPTPVKIMQQVTETRPTINDALELLCNRDSSWVQIASNDQSKRILNIMSRAYGYYGKGGGNPDNMAGAANKKQKIPEHEHVPEICAQYNCKQ